MSPPSEATTMTLRSRLAFSPSPRPLSTRDLFSEGTPPRARRHQHRRDEQRAREVKGREDCKSLPKQLDVGTKVQEAEHEAVTTVTPSSRRSALVDKYVQSSPQSCATARREEVRPDIAHNGGPDQDHDDTVLPVTLYSAVAVPLPAQEATSNPATASKPKARPKPAPSPANGAKGTKAVKKPEVKPASAPKVRKVPSEGPVRPGKESKKEVVPVRASKKPEKKKAGTPAQPTVTLNKPNSAQKTTRGAKPAQAQVEVVVEEVPQPKAPIQGRSPSKKEVEKSKDVATTEEGSVASLAVARGKFAEVEPPPSFPPSSPNRYLAQQQQAQVQDEIRQAISTVHFFDADDDLEYIDQDQYSPHQKRRMDLGIGGHIPAGRLGGSSSLKGTVLDTIILPAHSTPRRLSDDSRPTLVQKAVRRPAVRSGVPHEDSESEDEAVQLSSKHVVSSPTPGKERRVQHHKSAPVATEAEKGRATVGLSAPATTTRSPLPQVCIEDDPFGFASIGPKVMAMLKISEQNAKSTVQPDSQTQVDGQFTPPNNASPILASFDLPDKVGDDANKDHTSSELSDFESDEDKLKRSGKMTSKRGKSPSRRKDKVESEIVPISIDEVCAAFSMTSGALPAGSAKGGVGAKAASRGGRGRNTGRTLVLQGSGELRTKVAKPKGQKILELTPSETIVPSKRKVTVATDSFDEVLDDDFDVPPGMTSREVKQNRDREGLGSTRGRGRGKQGSVATGRNISKAASSGTSGMPPTATAAPRQAATRQRPRPRPSAARTATDQGGRDMEWDALPQPSKGSSQKPKSTTTQQRGNSLIESQPVLKAGARRGQGQKRARQDVTLVDGDDDVDDDDDEDDRATSKLKATKDYFNTLNGYQLTVEAAP